MAKKINKKAAVKEQFINNFIPKSRSSRVIIGLVFLAVIVAVPFYVKHREVVAEKQDFLSKFQRLEVIANNITNNHKPDAIIDNQSCHYASGSKYERGALSCSVSIQIIYKSVEVEQSNNILQKSSKLISSMPVYNYLKPEIVVFPKIWDSQADQIFQDFDEQELKNCGVTYSYPYPLMRDKNLLLSLACSHNAKAEHFPVKN